MTVHGTTKFSCGAAPSITGTVHDTIETTPQPIKATLVPGLIPVSNWLPIRWLMNGRTNR